MEVSFYESIVHSTNHPDSSHRSELSTVSADRQPVTAGPIGGLQKFRCGIWTFIMATGRPCFMWS